MSKSTLDYSASVAAFLNNGGKITVCPPKNVGSKQVKLAHPLSNRYKEEVAALNA